MRCLALILLVFTLMLTGCQSSITPESDAGAPGDLVRLSAELGGDADGVGLELLPGEVILAVYLLDGTPVEPGSNLAPQTQVEIHTSTSRVKVVTWGSIKDLYHNGG